MSTSLGGPFSQNLTRGTVNNCSTWHSSKTVLHAVVCHEERQSLCGICATDVSYTARPCDGCEDLAPFHIAARIGGPLDGRSHLLSMHSSSYNSLKTISMRNVPEAIAFSTLSSVEASAPTRWSAVSTTPCIHMVFVVLQAAT